jgi:Tfp pilus assembly protein FimT
MGFSRARAAGVTLAELLVVTAVIAVLAGTAISLLSGGHTQTAAEEAAHRVAADIAFAQADAIAQRMPRTLIFDAGNDTYQLCQNGTLLVHPVSKKSYAVDVGNLFSGTHVDLRDPDFGGTDSLRFGADGAPLCGGSVAVETTGHRIRISVSATTGRIDVTVVPPAEMAT